MLLAALTTAKHYFTVASNWTSDAYSKSAISLMQAMLLAAITTARIYCQSLNTRNIIVTYQKPAEFWALLPLTKLNFALLSFNVTAKLTRSNVTCNTTSCRHYYGYIMYSTRTNCGELQFNRAPPILRI